MAKKKQVKYHKRSSSGIQKNNDFLSQDLRKDVKEIGKEIRTFENWTYQRRKFLIKFALVFGILVLILLLAHFY